MYYIYSEKYGYLHTHGFSKNPLKGFPTVEDAKALIKKRKERTWPNSIKQFKANQKAFQTKIDFHEVNTMAKIQEKMNAYRQLTIQQVLESKLLDVIVNTARDLDRCSASKKNAQEQIARLDKHIECYEEMINSNFDVVIITKQQIVYTETKHKKVG